ncbi:hypothetical protein ACFVWZ_02125 [Streptomyces sp. NPDC058200]|uniref:hypothetical protein n=1 Tax=Streptomyces sp. NPDC058200 TaxID=3346378 RepID=UPI0036EB2953
MGAIFFAVLTVARQIERNYIRKKTLEGQVTAAAKGNHGGRPKVIDDDMLTFTSPKAGCSRRTGSGPTSLVGNAACAERRLAPRR